MKLIKVEYSGKSSKGIYGQVTFKTILGKIKTCEAFLNVYNFERSHYSNIAFWVSSGRSAGGLFSYSVIVNEIIRSYENSKTN